MTKLFGLLILVVLSGGVAQARVRAQSNDQAQSHESCKFRTLEATYYRFWQGFKKSGVSAQDFLRGLPGFMQSTVNVYNEHGLNNYLVGIPPVAKPSFIPDEFALVAFDSERSYRAVRSTPNGQAYADSHWTLFDGALSKSAPLKDLEQSTTQLEVNTAYSILAKPVNWNADYVTFYVGIRKPNVASADFIAGLTQHVRTVAAQLKSLTGYLMLATPDYEVAYLAFPSKAVADAAFATPGGKLIAAQGAQLMDPLIFTPAEPFYASAEPGHFYSTGH